MARVGDVVDEGYELLEFRYAAVVLGRGDPPLAGEKVRLERWSP